MSDIVERLRKLVVLDEVGSNNPLAREATNEIERLRAERDALKKDAERYRWLRANSNKLNYCLLCGYDGLDCWEESDLDIQIDAAMEESK